MVLVVVVVVVVVVVLLLVFNRPFFRYTPGWISLPPQKKKKLRTFWIMGVRFTGPVPCQSSSQTVRAMNGPVKASTRTLSHDLSNAPLTLSSCLPLELHHAVLAESGRVRCRNYSLCEVTFSDDGFVKTRHLPEQLDNLAERISLNSRCAFYSNDLPADIFIVGAARWRNG